MSGPLDMGESLAGAYQRYVAGYDFVHYGTHTENQGEIDLIGLGLNPPRVVLCEVATHLDGLRYGNAAATAKKVRQKMLRAVKFAAERFPHQERRYEWWSPRVAPGLQALLVEVVEEMDTAGTALELVSNELYAHRVAELIAHARTGTSATGEPFYRALQILTHLRVSTITGIPQV